jgi:hypothetical protein
VLVIFSDMRQPMKELHIESDATSPKLELVGIGSQTKRGFLSAEIIDPLGVEGAGKSSSLRKCIHSSE